MRGSGRYLEEDNGLLGFGFVCSGVRDSTDEGRCVECSELSRVMSDGDMGIS